MKKTITILALAFTVLFTGCANSNEAQVSYDYENHKKIKEILVGNIINTRNVNVKGDEFGILAGTVVGGVVGSTIGKGDGEKLATLGGAVLGAIVGDNLSATNAQELTVTLQNGNTIVVLSKETNFIVGEKIKIVKVGDEVSSVYKI